MKEKKYTFEELREIAKTELNKYSVIEPIIIEFKHIHRGHCNNGYISIPLWATKRKQAYLLYYVIHEITHAICHAKGFGYGHSKQFKEIETEILSRYNIFLVYAKAYPKELRDKEQNKICGALGA